MKNPSWHEEPPEDEDVDVVADAINKHLEEHGPYFVVTEVQYEEDRDCKYWRKLE